MTFPGVTPANPPAKTLNEASRFWTWKNIKLIARVREESIPAVG